MPYRYYKNVHGNVSPFAVLYNAGYTNVKKNGITIKIFDCPGDRSREYGYVKNGYYNYEWQKEGGKPVNRSYAVNLHLGYFKAFPVYWSPFKFGKAATPASKIILMTDIHDYIASSNPNIYGLAEYQTTMRTDKPDSHHQGTDNVLAAGGNVRSFKGIYTWKDTTIFQNPPVTEFTYTE